MTRQLLFWCVVLLASCMALYEDEISSHWKLDNLGLATHAAFHQRHAIISTDTNTIASVAIRSGSIDWRRTLDSPITSLEVSTSAVYCMLSTGHVYAFHVTDGALLWEALAPNAEDAPTCVRALSVAAVRSVDAVFVHYGNSVVAISEGRVAWNWTPASGTVAGVKVRDGQTLAAVLTPDGDLTTTDLSDRWSASGEEAEAEESRQPHAGYTAECPSALPTALTADIGHVVSLKGDTLQILDLARSSSRLTTVPLSGLAGMKSTESGLSLVTSALTDAIVLRAQGSGARYVISVVENSPTVLTTLSPAQRLHNPSPVVLDKRIVPNILMVSGPGPKGSLLLFSAPDAGEVTIPSPCHIARSFAQRYQKKSGAVGFRVLAVCESGETTAYSLGESGPVTLWEREEALAHAVTAKLVLTRDSADSAGDDEDIDFHAPSLMGDAQRTVMALATLINGFVSDGPAWAVSVATEVQARFARVADEGLSALRSPVSASHHAAEGVAVVLTSTGRTLGLSLADGRVLWAHTHTRPNVAGKLIEVRRAGILSARLVQIAVDGDSTQIVWFDPLTGEALTENSLSFAATDSFMLPTLNSHHAHIIALLDSNHVVHAFDSDGPVTSVPSFFHHMITPDAVVGLEHSQDAAPGSAMVPVWRVVFGEGEKVVSSAQRRKHSKASSAVLVKGDRQVLHKYLNPNMLAIATAKTSATGEGTVSLYLVDVVAGRMLHHSTHPHTMAPVHFAIADNDVIATMWNSGARANELVAMELFEDRTADNVLDLLFNSISAPKGLHNITHYSSFNRPLPQVVSRQYLLPRPVSTLAYTETGSGISSKLLLVGLTSDQILAVDRRQINPRQPDASPTPEQMEEQLVPYQMLLPFNPMLLATYNQSVSGLRFVETDAGGYESESHMLAVGTDILYRPLHPSGTFDQLAPDFNRVALVGAVTALAVAYVMLAHADNRGQLRKKWR